jgi:hypothetical protein
MADPEHLDILQRGVPAWNRWRRANRGVRPDLSGDTPDDLSAAVEAITSIVLNEVMPGQTPVSTTTGPLAGAQLVGADLRDADLSGACLDRAALMEARLDGADLRGARLAGAVLTGAHLRSVDATGADLNASTLRWADLRGADLSGAMCRLMNADGVRARSAKFVGADLFYASFVQADLTRADLSDAHVYATTVWDTRLQGAIQHRLVITRASEPTVLVDDLQVAQFLHLIMTNARIRGVIDTLATSVVLILGRFTPGRKEVLRAVAEALRHRGLVPVLFDFERPASRDYTETVTTLAHLARFIVADLTDPASVPKELEAIVPTLAVPVVPLIEHGHRPYAMFSDYWKYDWVLDVVEYRSIATLTASLDRTVVSPAERMADELTRRRAGSRRPDPRARRRRPQPER